MAVPAATPVTVAAELVVDVVPFVTVAILELLVVQDILFVFVTFDNVAVKLTVLPATTDVDDGETTADGLVEDDEDTVISIDEQYAAPLPLFMILTYLYEDKS